MFFLCWQYQILEQKKVFTLKKVLFITNFRFEMWQIPAPLQASLDFPQLEGALLSLSSFLCMHKMVHNSASKQKVYSQAERPAQLKT